MFGLRPIPVMATARPQKPRIRAKDVHRAIDHARLLCMNYEDTVECRLAWEEVEELSKAMHKQTLAENKRTRHEADETREIQRRIEVAQREYDV